MPNYWNPSNMYPVTYPQFQMPMMPQQSFTQPTIAAAWVESEMEARGKSMPQGVNQFFMFDANQQKIYLKSLNQMGMPNPMQTLNFTMENQQQNLPAGQSGMMSGTGQDMSNYVTRQDFEQLRNEIRQMNQSGAANGNSNNSVNGQSYANNQNGSSNGNRGGNR